MGKALKYTGLAILLLIAAVLIWSLIEPYTLDQERYAVSVPNLPAGWEGATVAVVGDFQVGMWLDNQSTVRQAVSAVIEERPAVTLIVGDFVYHVIDPEGDEIDQVVALIRPLVDAGIPTYAVLGNHDYSLAKRGGEKREELAAAVEAALEEAGVIVLQNEAASLEAPAGGEPLYIVGIGSRYARNDRPEIALEDVPSTAARIVMMHHPNSFPEIATDSAPLAVAGHTHGGQLSLPFTPHWSLISLYLREEAHAEGWKEASFGSVGNRLYVNRGIGMSLVPMRFLTPPELTFFTLQVSTSEELEQPVELD